MERHEEQRESITMSRFVELFLRVLQRDQTGDSSSSCGVESEVHLHARSETAFWKLEAVACVSARCCPRLRAKVDSVVVMKAWMLQRWRCFCTTSLSLGAAGAGGKASLTS